MIKGCGKKFPMYNFIGDNGENIRKREKCGDITILDNKTILLCKECSHKCNNKSEAKK